MKKKFYRSCVSMLLTMVMIFGGVHIGAGAVVVRPPIISTLVSVDIATPATTNIGVGNTLQLTCTTDPGGCPITWSSSNQSVATISSSGLVTGVSAGSTTITVTARDPIVSSFYLTDSITIMVCDSTGISNGTVYYIMNAGSDRLLGRQTSDYLSTANIATVAFSSKNNAKWTVAEQSDGSFSLMNMNGNAGSLYLNVNGTDVTLAYGFKKFSIYRMITGDYEGLYLIKYGNQYVAQNTNYDAYLTSTLSENCYWSFMKVEKDKATHYCLYCEYVNAEGNDETFNVTLNMDDFQAVLGTELGYEHVYAYKNGESADAFDDLQDSDIFIYSGHGLPGGIYFYDEDNQHIGSIIVDDIFYEGDAPNFYFSDIPDNGLANARCVIYMACNTGDDKEDTYGRKYNLVDKTFEKGAHFVLGTTEGININDINRWIDNFLGYIFEGNNIDYAAYCASEDLGMIVLKDKKEDGSLKYHWGLPEYSVGDRYQYLNIE